MPKHEQSKTWKYFEKNELTHSAAHYLMTIHELKEKDGYARLSDIASHMDITAGSCSITLGKLKEKGLIQDDEKKFYHLTSVGEELIEQVIKNEAVFQEFFHKVLGVDRWQSEIDACKIEHLISPDTSEALCQFLRFLDTQGLLADSFLKSFQKFQGADHQCQNCEKDCALKT